MLGNSDVAFGGSFRADCGNFQPHLVHLNAPASLFLCWHSCQLAVMIPILKFSRSRLTDSRQISVASRCCVSRLRLQSCLYRNLHPRTRQARRSPLLQGLTIAKVIAQDDQVIAACVACYRASHPSKVSPSLLVAFVALRTPLSCNLDSGNPPIRNDNILHCSQLHSFPPQASYSWSALSSSSLHRACDTVSPCFHVCNSPFANLFLEYA